MNVRNVLSNPDSDIDVAVIVPTYGDRKFENNSSG